MSPSKVGTVRPSQLLYTFGIGSLVDLPRISAVVMGIDEWDLTEPRPIDEPRLLEAVRAKLGSQVDRLLNPPRPPEETPGLYQAFGKPPAGVPVATFPRWLLCPLCRLLAPLSSGLFTLEHNRYRPDNTHYRHENCARSGGRKAIPALPVRFLVACQHGHLDDFPWLIYVHGGPAACTGPLRMLEFGLSGEASAVQVRCDVCGTSKSMARAFQPEGKAEMPICRGRRPWLRDFAEGCDCQVEPLLLGASGSWFPLTLSALAIPSESNTLATLVEERWTTLEKIVNRTFLEASRAFHQLGPLEAYDDEDLWKAIEAKRHSPAEGDGKPENLRSPEWRAFSGADPARNTPDFRLQVVAVPRGYEQSLHQVVLAERLREVQAFIGFTRIEAPGDWAYTEEIDDETRAPIGRHAPTWVPAAQVRGEGIFIQFSEKALAAWERRIPVLKRAREFRLAHGEWRVERGLEDTDQSFPGLRYVLLHSFAHALMRQLSLECGYSSASMRERLYALQPHSGGDPMAGVLIYTSAPDSEGTLGGLVRLGQPEHLRRHITQALELVRLCASDPLCSEHDVNQDAATLHGAACHACLFVPETSCERGNRYLDRSTLVETFSQGDVCFFKESPWLSG